MGHIRNYGIPNIAIGADTVVYVLSPFDGSLIVDRTRLLGGAGDDIATAGALGADGQLYITGSTTSANFPATINAFQPQLNGSNDAFLLRINPSVTNQTLYNSNIVYATYLGGLGVDQGLSVSANVAGIATLGGTTTSSDFPLRLAIQPAIKGTSDGFIAAINTLTGNLVSSTYLGSFEVTAGGDSVRALVREQSGRIIAAGRSGGPGFSATPMAWVPSFPSSSTEAGFLIRFSDSSRAEVFWKPVEMLLMR